LGAAEAAAKIGLSLKSSHHLLVNLAQHRPLSSAFDCIPYQKNMVKVNKDQSKGKNKSKKENSVR
jgi:hypothetical protein